MNREAGAIFFFVLGFTCCFCSRKCSDQEIKPQDTFSVVLNGKNWSGESRGGYLVDSLFGFYVLRKNSQGFERENLGIGNIPKKLGRFPLINSKWDRSKIISSYSTSQDDGDVGCDLYYVYPGDSLINFIEVTAIQNNMVTGNFQGSFLREKGTDGKVCEPTKPDTIRFSEGYFKIYIGHKY